MTAEHGGGSIASFLVENRVFPPPAEFSKAAHVASLEHYQQLWDHAKNDPAGFWAEMATNLEWMAPWTQVLDWEPPFAKWFVGGKLNASANCVDRHALGTREKQARDPLRG